MRTFQQLYKQHDAYPDAGGLNHRRRVSKRLSYYLAVIAVTLLPLLGLPLTAQFNQPFAASFVIGLGVFVGGVCHVASTLSFYFDAEARELMKHMKTRFFWLPGIVIILSAAALLAGALLPIPDDAVAALFMLHLIWLYYHYQKQNYGLLAFSAAANRRRLPGGTLTVLMLAAAAGGLATIPQLLADGLQRPLPIAALLPSLHTVAIALYAAAGVLLIVQFLRHPDIFRRGWICVFTLMAFGFFLPTLLVKDLHYAFWSYAIAHGLQYLLMVGIVSAQARIAAIALPLFVLSALGGGWLLDRFAGNHALFICGILLTWVHFILDARLWRMSDAPVRQFLFQRFAFILT